MKALILNNQIVQVEQIEFPVAEPLYWLDCPENCTTNWTYNGATFQEPQVPVITAEQNKQQAVQLLQQTDWVNQPDVTNTSLTPHLLNKQEFDTYRQAIRQIAVYPQAGELQWPQKPQEQWSQQ